jgi:hypothetical protein
MARLPDNLVNISPIKPIKPCLVKPDTALSQDGFTTCENIKNGSIAGKGNGAAFKRARLCKP